MFTALPDADGLVRSSPLLFQIGHAYYPSLSVATVAAVMQASSIRPLYDRTVDTLSENERDASDVEHVALFSKAGNVRFPVARA